ncbi:MAG: hypothetical protein ACLP7P_16995 [Rhodomicrobium sp.]
MSVNPDIAGKIAELERRLSTLDEERSEIAGGIGPLMAAIAA